LTFIKRNNVETLHRIIEGKAEIMEFIVGKNSKIIDSKIRNLKLPEDSIVATIVRRNEIVIPHGDDIIRDGDRVILIVKNSEVNELKDIVAGTARGKA
jgi:trk system potassium uptake protein TrkA